MKKKVDTEVTVTLTMTDKEYKTLQKMVNTHRVDRKGNGETVTEEEKAIFDVMYKEEYIEPIQPKGIDDGFYSHLSIEGVHFDEWGNELPLANNKK